MGAAIAALTVIYFAKTREARDSSVADLRLPIEEIEAPRPVDPEARVGAPRTGSPTMEATMSAYWGKDWDIVRARLLEEGANLEQPFVIVPWETVSAEILQELRSQPEELAKSTKEFYLEWPESMTLESLATKFRIPEGFTESDLYAVEELALEYNTPLEAVADQYALGVCLALDSKLAKGGYLKAPLSTKAVPVPADTTDNFFAASTAHGSGWCAKTALTKSECPDLVAMKGEMQRLQRERDQRLRTYFRNWSR